MIKLIKSTHWIVASALMLALAGCDGGSTPPSASDDQGDNGDNPDKVGGVVTTFNGDWVIRCRPADPAQPGEEYEVVTLNIDGDGGRILIYQYIDQNCANPDLPAVRGYTFDLAYPAGTTNTQFGDATWANRTPIRVTYDGEPATELQRLSLEATGFYDTYHEIFLINDGKLYVGADDEVLDGTTPEKRPVTLDPREIFERQ